MSGSGDSEERLVLIDTDAGTDDTLGILMALQAHRNPDMNFRIIGIVCVNGNTKIDNVCRNVTRILDEMEATEIPIYRGAEAPLVFPFKHKEHPPFHGFDGFGDAEFPALLPRLEKENGIAAIIRLAHRYQDRLTILGFGPMTNLALAVRTDPSIKDCIKEIYGMGGNIEGIGNTTVCAEFNFMVDPEAAYITLSTYKCPIYIVPWEVCQRQAVQTYEWRAEKLGKLDTPGARLLNKIESNILKSCQESNIWYPCDQVAAAALIEPDVIKKQANYHCTVELQGHHTRGLMVVDYPTLLNKPDNVTIITEIDPELLRKILIWGAGGEFYKK